MKLITFLLFLTLTSCAQTPPQPIWKTSVMKGQVYGCLWDGQSLWMNGFPDRRTDDSEVYTQFMKMDVDGKIDASNTVKDSIYFRANIAASMRHPKMPYLIGNRCANADFNKQDNMTSFIGIITEDLQVKVLHAFADVVLQMDYGPWLFETADQGYMLVSNLRSERNITVFHFDKNLNEISRQVVNSKIEGGLSARDCLIDTNGHLIIVSSYHEDMHQVARLSKFDDEMNATWTYEHKNGRVCHYPTIATDGTNIYIAGHECNADESKYFTSVIAINPSGKELWQAKDLEASVFTDILFDGRDIVAAGCKKYKHEIGEDASDYAIIKISTQGVVMSSNILNTDNYDDSNFIRSLGNNEYLLIGNDVSGRRAEVMRVRIGE